MSSRAFLLIILLALFCLGCGQSIETVKRPLPPVQKESAIGTGGKTDQVKPRCPSIKRAKSWASKRQGVSFAIICKGKLRGYHPGRHLQSASTGKALMLLAALRSHRVNKSLLAPMITQSDNQAAHQVYASLGDEPLIEASRRAGLKNTRLCRCWSYISWSAADYARLFYSFPGSLPREHRWWAMRQLKSITTSQRWGIKEASRGYKTYFKGGWRPEDNGWLVLQGALLVKKEERLALAVWTDSNPSLELGAAKIKKITKLILTSPARAVYRNGKTQSSS